MIRRLFPHPLMSATLVVVWLLLHNDVSVIDVITGVFLGTVIPLFTHVFWPERPKMARPGKILILCLRLLGDIVTANLVVALTILSPRAKPHPDFVEFPLELTDEFAITVLAGMISLSPGTVSAELSEDRRTLLIHALNVADKPALVAEIKRRYEHPLREIFPC